ncbi:MAG: DUF3597 domain-containing protein [Epsilonproteobacteria bacterium]|nr:DUF3597 domain-containing protein [Campylobacterota bacterium]
MGLFSSILSKLGFGDKANEENAQPVEVVASAKEEIDQANEAIEQATQEETPAPEAVVVEETVVAEIPVVDVMKHLEELSEKNPGLNWKTSIVDLLKLLGIESSYSFRKELAQELGCPDDLMAESAKMNVWLHKTVLKKIAENGGNIPQDLLD